MLDNAISVAGLLTSELQGLWNQLAEDDAPKYDAKSFEKHKDKVRTQLEMCLTDTSIGERVRYAEELKAAHGILDVAFTTAISLAKELSPKLAHGLEIIREQHSILVVELADLVAAECAVSSAPVGSRDKSSEEDEVEETCCQLNIADAHSSGQVLVGKAPDESTTTAPTPAIASENFPDTPPSLDDNRGVEAVITREQYTRARLDLESANEAVAQRSAEVEFLQKLLSEARAETAAALIAVDQPLQLQSQQRTRNEEEAEIKQGEEEKETKELLNISIEEFAEEWVAESGDLDGGEDKVLSPPATPPLTPSTWRSADAHIKSMRNIRTSSFFVEAAERAPATTPQPGKSSPAAVAVGRSIPPQVTERVPPASVSPMQKRIYSDAYPHPGWLPSPIPASVSRTLSKHALASASSSPGPTSTAPRGAVAGSFDLVLARQELRRAQQKPLARVLTLRETVAAIAGFVREKRAADEAVFNAWTEGTKPAPKLQTMEVFVLKSTWEKAHQRLRVIGAGPQSIANSPSRVRNPAKELALSYMQNGHEGPSRPRTSGHGTADIFRAAHEMENLAVFVQSVRAHCSQAGTKNRSSSGDYDGPTTGASDVNKSAALDEQADVDAFHSVWIGAVDEEIFVVQRSLRTAIKDMLSQFQANDDGKDGYIGREDWTSIVRALHDSDVHMHMHSHTHGHSGDLARTHDDERGMWESSAEGKDATYSPKDPEEEEESWRSNARSNLAQMHAHEFMHHPTSLRSETKKVTEAAEATSQANVFEILELLDARAQADHAATVGARQLSLLSANTGFLGQSSFRKLGYNVKSSACMSTLRKFASQRLRRQVASAVVDLGDQLAASSQWRASGAEVRLRLPVKVFVKTLLDFQLQQHVSFLAPLSAAFIDADSDRDGVLSRDEFSRLFMRALRKADYHIVPNIILENVYGKNWLGNVVILETKGRADTIACQSVLDKLFADIDPFKTDVVTFSGAAAAICRLCS